MAGKWLGWGGATIGALPGMWDSAKGLADIGRFRDVSVVVNDIDTDNGQVDWANQKAKEAQANADAAQDGYCQTGGSTKLPYDSPDPPDVTPNGLVHHGTTGPRGRGQAAQDLLDPGPGHDPRRSGRVVP